MHKATDYEQIAFHARGQTCDESSSRNQSKPLNSTFESPEMYRGAREVDISVYHRGKRQRCPEVQV